MRKNKYNAKKVTIDGIVFASTKEGDRYEQLKYMRKDDQIRNLRLQPKFPIVINGIAKMVDGKPAMIDGKPVKIRSEGFPNGRSVKYIADFMYDTPEGNVVIEDVKGFDTPISRLKRALVECIYDVEIVII